MYEDGGATGFLYIAARLVDGPISIRLFTLVWHWPQMYVHTRGTHDGRAFPRVSGTA